MGHQALLDELVGIVGPTHVLTGGAMAGFTTDWTGRWHGEADAVVRPGSTSEVSAIVRWCAREGIAIVPQGGNTGLVGGAVPQSGSIVLSTTRLSSIGAVDVASGQVTSGAGATVAAVAGVAAAAGWRYPVDLAARDSATIGGTIATNAGGHHVVRHGMTRRHVLGVEAVLGDGTVVSHLSGLVKDNTGYDLAGLLCGSEGTLGVITSARLALVPPAGDLVVALVGFDDLGEAMAAVPVLRQGLRGLEAIELMLADGLAAVGAHLGARAPLPESAAVLLVEAEGGAHQNPAVDLAEAIAGLSGVTDTAVATDSVGRHGLWRWREAHTEVINATGPHPPHKFDVTLPLATVAVAVADIRRAVERVDPTATVWIFGHAGDGNIHVNITGPAPDTTDVDAAVLEQVAAAGGSISAEHGIGRAKRSWMHLARSPEEIAAFRALKAALDPAGILNPGVLLPDRHDQRLS